MLLYLIQVFSFLACTIASLAKKKGTILQWTSFANLSNFAVMLLVQETDGWANSLSTVIRGLLFTRRDTYKTNTVLYICSIMHIVAFVVSYQNLWSVLLIIATLSICVSQWFGNPLCIKIFALIGAICWLCYVIYIKLYSDFPKRILEVILLVISLAKTFSEKHEEKLDAITTM